MPKKLQNIVTVAAATLGSRVLGLLRDVLIFSLFGTTAVNSAFIFAFTLPNLFRRLLGEGALTSALVPVFSEELKQEGKFSAFHFLNKVLTRASVVLLLLIVLGAGVLLYVHSLSGLAERWYLGTKLGVLLLPYMLLICLAALLGAVLNILGRFAVVALSAVWLNLSMIVALGLLGYFLSSSAEARVYWLCGGVLVGGLLQLILPAAVLWKEGWRPKLTLQSGSRLREVVVLFLPGVAGAAIFQINLLITRVLAFGLESSGVAALYLASRLVELPLGVFTIAVATVSFPALALLAADMDQEGMGRVYNQGLSMITAITLPAAAGLILWAKPILKVLFEWGIFDQAAVNATAPILQVYALALPFYSLATFSTRGFHSMKNTASPVRIALIAFGVNLGAALVLMRPLGVVGLALANLLSAIVQALLLAIVLGKRYPHLRLSRLYRSLWRALLATAVMSLFCWGAGHLASHLPWTEKQNALLLVVGGVPLAIGLYAACLLVLRYPDRQALLQLIPGLKRR